jgi:hypothetical protein
MNKKYDPHDDSYCAVNLDYEEWRVYKVDALTLRYAKVISEAALENRPSFINMVHLNDLSSRIAMEAGTPACLIPDFRGYHWAAMALCMLTNCRMEVLSATLEVKFERSPFKGVEPMYEPHTIVWKKENNKVLPFRRKDDATKDTGTPGNGENNKTDGTHGKGVERRSPGEQIGLFDFF